MTKISDRAANEDINYDDKVSADKRHAETEKDVLVFTAEHLRKILLEEPEMISESTLLQMSTYLSESKRAAAVVTGTWIFGHLKSQPKH